MKAGFPVWVASLLLLTTMPLALFIRQKDEGNEGNKRTHSRLNQSLIDPPPREIRRFGIMILPKSRSKRTTPPYMLMEKGKEVGIDSEEKLLHSFYQIGNEGPYPPPKIPLFPVLSFGTFIGVLGAYVANVRRGGHVVSVTTGRMGLTLALKDVCLKAGEKVLIPAYHCNSMVEPVVHMQGTPVFYHVLIQHDRGYRRR